MNKKERLQPLGTILIIYKRCYLPIIGTGGVSSGIDAAELIMAGATCVGVGTAIESRGPYALSAINMELQATMTALKHEPLLSMRGIAHYA